MSNVYTDLSKTKYPNYIDYGAIANNTTSTVNGQVHMGNADFKTNINFENRAADGSNREQYYVKAEDINALQDAVIAIQRTLGTYQTTGAVSDYFIKIADFIQMNYLTGNGSDDASVDNLEEKFYDGVGLPSGYGIKTHIHGANGISSVPIDTGTTGLLKKNRLYLTRGTSGENADFMLTASDLKMSSSATARTISQEIDRNITKKKDTDNDPAEIMERKLELKDNVKSQMFIEEDAVLFTRKDNTYDILDEYSYSGKALRLINTVAISSFISNKFKLRFGRFICAVRMKVKINAAPNLTNAGSDITLTQTKYNAAIDTTLFRVNAVKYESGSGTWINAGSENITLRKLIGNKWNNTRAEGYNTIYIDIDNRHLGGNTRDIWIDTTMSTDKTLGMTYYIDSIMIYPTGLAVYDME